MSDKYNKQEDETIDLGQLFTLIGNGFSKLFNFIGNILSAIFHWIILLLLFIKSHAVKLIIGAALGTVLGGIHQYRLKTPSYESSMTVQPNFGSAVQLYKNIEYYQSLVTQKDIERLSASLKITPQEAKDITDIEVNPYSNENQTILSYKNFIKDLDTITVKLIDYETFSREQPVESFKYHIVKVTSKDKYLFTKLEVPIISSIIQNTYYDKIKSTAFTNLISKKDALESSMIELDSLRSLYKEVMLSESQKENSGTNIFMSNAAQNNKEVVVFDKYMDMNESLIDVNKQITEENEVINVVSSFNGIGAKIGGLRNNNTVKGFILGFFLVLITLGLKELNTILSQYETKKVK